MNPVKSIQARQQNFLSRHFELSRQGRRLRKLKNIHRGEACFLIGNGPSLRPEDLTRIHEAGIPTFGFNRIFYIFGQTPWRPTYYISQDEKMLSGCAGQVSDLDLPYKFIPANLRWYHDIRIRGAREFFLEGARDADFWFGDDISHSLCWASTVMYTAAQFAAYMGFKTIYLLGVDHHFHISRDRNGNILVDDSVKDYFTDQYNADKDRLFIPSTDISTDTYYAMKRHCDARGIAVYNATRGGKLEVFPRVSFDSLYQNEV